MGKVPPTQNEERASPAVSQGRKFLDSDLKIADMPERCMAKFIDIGQFCSTSLGAEMSVMGVLNGTYSAIFGCIIAC